MARNDQVTRLFFLIHTLEGAPHGLTSKELLSRAQARGFDVQERTIYRDLEALETTFPFEYNIDPSTNAKRWVLGKHARVSGHFILNSRELFALYLAKGALEPLSQTPFYSDVQALFKKLEERLDEKSIEHISEVKKEVAFHVGPKWGADVDTNILATIRAGCAEGHILDIVYSSVNSGLTASRKVGPHFLYFSKGALYLLAEDIAEKRIKTFALPRFSSATITEDIYEGEPLDPDKYFANSFGAYHGSEAQKVELLFSNQIGTFIRERKYHASQKAVLHEKGIKFEFELAITPDFIQWILGFGHDCTVLAPESLKEELKCRAEKILKMYRAAG